MRGTVRFADGLAELLGNSQAILLEVGPGAPLAALARKQAGRDRANRVIACAADNAKDGQPLKAQSLLNALGKLWLSGAAVDWAALHAPARPRRTPLPTYPFDRQRYWIDARPEASAARRPARITRQPDMAGWFYEPAWVKSARAERATPSSPVAGPCLVLTDDSPASTAIVDRLRAAGAPVILARRGTAFTAGAGDYTLDPAVRAHYDSLIAAIVSHGHSRCAGSSTCGVFRLSIRRTPRSRRRRCQGSTA